MKFAKIFALFFLLHLLAWGAAHIYMGQNKSTVLIVADTSFSMKPEFTNMEKWIKDFDSSARYKNIVIGSDKAVLGKLAEMRSTSQIFRANYGRIKADSLQKFENIDAAERYLLSDGSIQPLGWTVVTFN